jgi:hypothetical protein
MLAVAKLDELKWLEIEITNNLYGTIVYLMSRGKSSDIYSKFIKSEGSKEKEIAERDSELYVKSLVLATWDICSQNQRAAPVQSLSSPILPSRKVA